MAWTAHRVRAAPRRRLETPPRLASAADQFLSPSRDKLFLNPRTKLVARRFRPEPSAQSVHFVGEMSERKEGRGKGKGKKKDRGSGRKPAPAAGGPSPGECAAGAPPSSSSAVASLSPARALRSGHLAGFPGVRGAGRFSPSVGPPLTWAASLTRAPALRVQGEGRQPGSAPSKGPGRAALPGTAFYQRLD